MSGIEDAVAALGVKLDAVITALGGEVGIETEYTTAIGAREKVAIVKATGGTLGSFMVALKSDAGAGPHYVQVHNAATATAPADATLAFPLGPITAGDVKVYDLGKMALSAGIKLAISQTEDTYTAAAADKAAWHALKV